MKAVVSVEGGETFLIDIRKCLLTVNDLSGKPVSTSLLSSAPVIVPGKPLVMACADGKEMRRNLILNVIYRD